jgi:hypothetical protein
MLAMLLAPIMLAQVNYPPAAIDLSSVATKSDVEAVQTAAQAAVAAAAAKCAPMAAVPPPEAIGGAAGSGTNCRLANSVQPRISRTVAFTTNSGGTAAVTWTDMGTAPLVFAVPNVASGAAQGPICYPVAGTITSVGATIKCFTTQSVSVSILGAVVAPLTTAGAGVTGQVLAIPAS